MVLAAIGVSRLRAFYGAIALGIGGVALAVAWHAGPQKYLDQRAFASLTARAPAHIVESWLAVEFDPARIGNYPDWHPFAKASPCIVVEFESAWSGKPRRAYCGTRRTFYDHITLHDLRETAPGVPFEWARDERGFAALQIRVSTPAKHYLDTHVADVIARPQDIPAGAELAALKAMYDRPTDDAIAGWRDHPANFMIAFDPAQPVRAWPVGFIADIARRTPDWFTTAAGLLIGACFWFYGWTLVMGSGVRAQVVIIGTVTLLAVPWWGSAFPRMLRGMNAPFGEVIADMLGDVDALDRLVLSSPDDATLADGQRIVWRTGDTLYADTFGQLPLRRPAPAPADDDAALDALADAVVAHVRTLDPQARTALFARLARDKTEGRARAGYVFVRAARDALVDVAREPDERRSATRFLEAWVTQPVEEPWPRDLAFAARIRLLRELMALPRPNAISIPAGWIVERAEARAAAPR